MKNENAQISVEVTKDSITVGTWREAKYGRFNDVNTIRTFVYESLKSGAEWTCEETTPHFRYRGIAFFVNGNSIEDNNDKRVDAIAIPWFELRDRNLTESNITDLIRSKRLKLPNPKTSIKNGKKAYLLLGIGTWEDMNIVFEYIEGIDSNSQHTIKYGGC